MGALLFIKSKNNRRKSNFIIAINRLRVPHLNFFVWIACAVTFSLSRIKLVQVYVGAYTGCDGFLSSAVIAHDLKIMAFMLLFLALAILFPRFKVLWIVLLVWLISAYCIDIIVFHILSQRLYLSDILKFFREIVTIREISGQLLSQSLGFILVASGLAWIIHAVQWCISQHKRLTAILLIVVSAVMMILGFNYKD